MNTVSLITYSYYGWPALISDLFLVARLQCVVLHDNIVFVFLQINTLSLFAGFAPTSHCINWQIRLKP